MDDFPQVLTIEEASRYLRIPLSTLYKLSQDGKIPCQKVGRHWRFRKERIDNWLDDTIAKSKKQTPINNEEQHGC
jgi:excisionase family DNA binding protein